MSNNEEIKKVMKENRIAQWRLARVLLVSDITVHRALREEMPEDKYKLYMAAVQKLIKAKA